MNPADGTPQISEADNLVFDKIAELKANLQADHPRIMGLIKEIHSALSASPQTMTLLTEDQVAAFFQGLQIAKQVTLGPATAKASKAASTRALKKELATFSSDDF